MKLIFEAIEFAAKAHAGRFRKGTKIPYILHPLSAAKTLIDCECPDEMVIAAILHDTVEDTWVTLQDIRQEFGEEVARIVEGCTEPNGDEVWEERKGHTIAYLEEAATDILIVSLSDKIDNIRAIREDFEKMGERVWQRFRRPREKQQWYYRSLAGVFARRALDEPASTLCRIFLSEVQKVFGQDG